MFWVLAVPPDLTSCGCLPLGLRAPVQPVSSCCLSVSASCPHCSLSFRLSPVSHGNTIALFFRSLLPSYTMEVGELTWPLLATGPTGPLRCDCPEPALPAAGAPSLPRKLGVAASGTEYPSVSGAAGSHSGGPALLGRRVYMASRGCCLDRSCVSSVGVPGPREPCSDGSRCHRGRGKRTEEPRDWTTTRA